MLNLPYGLTKNCVFVKVNPDKAPLSSAKRANSALMRNLGSYNYFVKTKLFRQLANHFFTLIFFTVLLASCNSTKNQEYDLAIYHINLVDGTGSPMKENVNIYVSDGKIIEISSELLPGATAKSEFDGTGKYLIPGLMEAHAHPSRIDVDTTARKSYNHQFKTMVHFGITSTILFGGGRGSYANMKELQESAENGNIISPRVFYSSPIVTTEGGHPYKTYPSSVWVDGETIYYLKDAGHAKKIVSEAKENGAIGIKLVVEDGPTPPFVERMDSSLINSIVREAHSASLPVYAHTSDIEEVRICMKAGIDNLVHFLGTDIPDETDEDLMNEMVKRGVSWITTLTLGKSLFFYRMHPEWLERPEIADVYDSSLVNALKSQVNFEASKGLLKEITGNDTLTFAEFLLPVTADVKKAHDAGINIVLGTDVLGDDYVLAGFSLHEEMEIMQMGGISPLQIIKMATYNGAKMLGIEKDYGSVEKGKFADFVILMENPLSDITHTLSIEKVFKSGLEQPRIQNE